MKPTGLRQWAARSVPGAVLLATVVDDIAFGGLIVGAGLAHGTIGVVLASAGFVALSIGMAAITAWALRNAPLQLSPRSRRRLDALHGSRFGRHLVPHPERLLTTAIVAAALGSVVPVIVVALHREGPAIASSRLVGVSGLAYGVAFAAGYGLLGGAVAAVV